MPALIIDTSTPSTILCLTKENQLLASQEFPHNNRLSQLLLPSIHDFLLQNTISPKELSYVACGSGPGSYTGTRVGVAVAMGLCFGLDIPLVSFCSLLAFLPASCLGTFAFAVKDSLGTFFLLTGEQKEKVSLSPPVLNVSPDALYSHLQQIQHIISFDLDFLRKTLSVFPPKETWCWHAAAPDFFYLASFAYQKFQSKEYSLQGKVEFLYFHPVS